MHCQVQRDDLDVLVQVTLPQTLDEVCRPVQCSLVRAAIAARTTQVVLMDTFWEDPPLYAPVMLPGSTVPLRLGYSFSASVRQQHQ